MNRDSWYEAYWNKNKLNEKIKRTSHLFIYNRFLKNHKNKTLSVLDVGTGNGKFLNFLMKKTKFKLFGTDLIIVDSNNKYIKKWDVDKHKLPFNKKFDIIISCDVVEHIFDLENYFSEIKSKMKVNSSFILFCPNFASLTSRIALIFGFAPPWISYEAGSGKEHIRFMTRHTIKYFAKKYGFKIVKQYGNDLKLPLWRGRSINLPFLINIFPFLGENMVYELKIRNKK